MEIEESGDAVMQGKFLGTTNLPPFGSYDSSTLMEHSENPEIRNHMQS